MQELDQKRREELLNTFECSFTSLFCLRKHLRLHNYTPAERHDILTVPLAPGPSVRGRCISRPNNMSTFVFRKKSALCIISFENAEYIH